MRLVLINVMLVASIMLSHFTVKVTSNFGWAILNTNVRKTMPNS